MKIFSPILIFLALTATPVYADDLQDAVNAYKYSDYEKAFISLKPFADKGNALAQYYLGQLYQYGQGVKQDYKKAAELYRLAVEQEHHYAQYALGELYQNGQGVEQDYQKAAKLYRLGAEAGNHVAQHALALLYQNGQGVEQDYLEAVKWLLVAADKGSRPAQILRRQIRYHKQIKQAAEKGDVYAQTFLGANYYLGLNVNRDYKESAKWYKKAAEQGSVAAQNILGAMNEKGKGITQDYVVANKWFTISEKSGDYYGRLYREKIEKRMDPAQIEKSRKLAKEWLDEHGNKP